MVIFMQAVPKFMQSVYQRSLSCIVEQEVKVFVIAHCQSFSIDVNLNEVPISQNFSSNGPWFVV